MEWKQLSQSEEQFVFAFHVACCRHTHTHTHTHMLHAAECEDGEIGVLLCLIFFVISERHVVLLHKCT